MNQLAGDEEIETSNEQEYFMKNRILEILKSSEGVQSGQTISQLTGVSRAAVWKHIQQLRESGYEIDAKTRCGYRLSREADVFSQQSLEQWFSQSAGQQLNELIFEQTTTSTNTMARQAAERGAPDRTVCVAEQQTAGRGRRGRSWHSDATGSLTFSILYRPKLEPAAVSSVTLLAGLAVARGLNGLLDRVNPTDGNKQSDKSARIGLKWPNDLIISGSKKKLGGILTEAILEESRVDALIIGVGINLNQTDFPPDLQHLATSLKNEFTVPFRRLEVLDQLVRYLDIYYNRLPERDSWLAEYRSQCLTLGKPVWVINQTGEKWSGIAREITDSGELVVEQSNGEQVTVYSGEVSVRWAKS